MDLFLKYWNLPLIGDNAGSLTIGNIATILVVMFSLAISLRWFRRRIVPSLAKRIGTDPGSLHSFALIINYTIGLFAFLVLIQASGVNLHALTIIFGALSVGIGFGLQNVVNNFVCGIVMLFERPVRIGDRVTIDGYEGDIVDIAMRSTTVRTNEGISVVVPNAQFITSTVVNRSLDEHRIRLKIPVNVAYGSDPETVRNVLLEVAGKHPGTLREPEPVVVFAEYGTHALEFFLWVWTEDYTHRPTLFKSEMNYLIHGALKQAGIQVPYPQLDVHVKTG